MADILIIEDDVAFSQLLERFLSRQDYGIKLAHSIKAGTECLKGNTYDLILLDYRLPDGLGIDILTTLRDMHSTIPAVIMTSFHDVRTAVNTIRLGAHDYITKPVNPDELLFVIKDVLNKKVIKKEDKKSNAAGKPALAMVLGKSAAAKKLHEYIQLVAPTDFSVIIQGDSGTGKELAARSIHNLSKRKNAPFVALDCGALSPELAGSELFGHVKGAFTGAMNNKTGQFEEADGGTIFLDEVGNLSYEIQVKLLRALQEREIQPVGGNRTIKIDVRIITATNDNILNAVHSGKFREDLYHRLNEFKIDVPPLHKRKEDIPLFIDFFIKQANEELGKQVRGVSNEVAAVFLGYDWPGNLRELKNIVKRAVLLAGGEEITTATLPQEMLLSVQPAAPDARMGLKATQEISEKEQIVDALAQTKYNKSKAAKLLNIDRTTLYYKMAKYNIG